MQNNWAIALANNTPVTLYPKYNKNKDINKFMITLYRPICITLASLLFLIKL